MVCNCSLAGTTACKNCPNYIREFGATQPEPVIVPVPTIMQFPSYIPTNDVRFEVIDEDGRKYVRYNVNIEFSIQDDNRPH